MWNTRNDNVYSGKILAIFSKNGQEINKLFFTKDVKQPSIQTIKFLLPR